MNLIIRLNQMGHRFFVDGKELSAISPENEVVRFFYANHAPSNRLESTFGSIWYQTDNISPSRNSARFKTFVIAHAYKSEKNFLCNFSIFACREKELDDPNETIIIGEFLKEVSVSFQNQGRGCVVSLSEDGNSPERIKNAEDHPNLLYFCGYSLPDSFWNLYGIEKGKNVFLTGVQKIIKDGEANDLCDV